MDGWKGVLDNTNQIFYSVQVRVGPAHYEPVGSAAFTIEDARKERDRLQKIPLFANQKLTVWKMEQSVNVGRCGVVPDSLEDVGSKFSRHVRK